VLFHTRKLQSYKYTIIHIFFGIFSDFVGFYFEILGGLIRGSENKSNRDQKFFFGGKFGLVFIAIVGRLLLVYC